MKFIDEIRMDPCVLNPSVVKDIAFLLAIFIGAHTLNALVPA